MVLLYHPAILVQRMLEVAADMHHAVNKEHGMPLFCWSDCNPSHSSLVINVTVVVMFTIAVAKVQ